MHTFIDTSRNKINFGKLLHDCLGVGLRGCASIDDEENNSSTRYIVNRRCIGKSSMITHCVVPPLSLALSITWESKTELKETIKDFISVIDNKINLADIFVVGSEEFRSTSYIFRGMVCYYGLHYISIFQDYCNGEPRFLLFDGNTFKEIIYNYSYSTILNYNLIIIL
jgi:hypothetical protein